MNRTQQILTGVLIVQIILAVVTLWPEPPKEPGVALLGGITADQITSFSVADNTGSVVTLERSGDTWVISGTDDFPANSETVTKVLEDLVLVKTGRTVATSPDSFARLQVADDDFLRRIWIKDDQGKEYTLYLGSTVGTSATHVRLSGSNETLLTDMVTAYDFGNSVRNWIDPTYVEVPRAQMTKMTLQNSTGTYEFTNEGTSEEENWVMAGLKSGEVFNPNNMVSMLTRLTNLQMTVPLGKTEKPEYGMDEPSAIVTLDYTDDAGNAQQLVLTVGALDETDGTYYVHASTSEYYVKIQSYTMTDFVERSKEIFLKADAAK